MTNIICILIASIAVALSCTAAYADFHELDLIPDIQRPKGESVPVNCNLVYEEGRITKEPHKLTAQMLMDALDCLVKAETLTKVAAQWLILKKSFWTIEESDMTIEEFHRLVESGEETHSTIIEFSNQPYDPNLKHKIKVLLKLGLASDRFWIPELFKHLERDIFPLALTKHREDREGKKSYYPYTEHSFRSSFNHHVAMEAEFHPLRYHNDISGFGGTDPLVFFDDREFDRFRPLLEMDPIAGRDWNKIWELYADIDQCHTTCLQQMERRSVRGSFVMLSHIDLVKYVHAKNHNHLGCSDPVPGGIKDPAHPTLEEIERIRQTRQSYFSDQAYEYMTNFGINMGKGGFMGRSLYFSAIDRGSLDRRLFQGQNGIVRQMSEAAVDDFVNYFNDTLGGDISSPDEFNLKYVHLIHDKFKGVSHHLISYWRYRRCLEKSANPYKARCMGFEPQFPWQDPTINDPSHEITDKERKSVAKLHAGQMYLYHRPFLTETYFTPIFTPPFFHSKASLADWVEKLYSENPRTPYQIFAYNYVTPSIIYKKGDKPGQGQRSSSSYYNFVVDAINSRPPIHHYYEPRPRLKTHPRNIVKGSRGDHYTESGKVQYGTDYTFQELKHKLCDVFGMRCGQKRTVEDLKLIEEVEEERAKREAEVESYN